MQYKDSGEEYMVSSETVKSFDGRVWAQHFLSIVNQDPFPAIDEEFITTWFCNAIMAGYDAGFQLAKTQNNQPESTKGEGNASGNY